MNLIQTFGSMECPVPKAAVLCVARKMLKDRDRLSRLLRRVLASGCESCWLWISALREEDVNEAELTNLVLLSKQAQGSNFPLWNMHGGFFSALLNKHGMNGFSHGIGYGESKDVLPVGVGALPTVAFHYNPLHVRCSVLDIERGFSSLGINDADAFHETVCDCVMCKGTLKGDLRNFRKYGELILKKGNSRQSQSAESAKRCRFHFLLARRKELDYVNARTIDELRSDLSAIVDEYTNLSSSIPLRSKSSALRQWVSAF
jgi:septum formation topological specificity factor MinE